MKQIYARPLLLISLAALGGCNSNSGENEYFNEVPFPAEPTPTEAALSPSNCYSTDGEGNLVFLGEPEEKGTMALEAAQSSPSDISTYTLCDGDIPGPINITSDAKVLGDPGGGTRIVMPLVEEGDEGDSVFGFYAGEGVNTLHISELAIHGQGGGSALKSSGIQDFDLNDIAIDGSMDFALELESVTGNIQNINVDLDSTGRGIYIINQSALTLETVNIENVYGDGVYVEDSEVLINALSVENIRHSSYLSPADGKVYDTAGLRLLSTGEPDGAKGEVTDFVAKNTFTNAAISLTNATLILDDALISDAYADCVRAFGASDLEINGGDFEGCNASGVVSNGSSRLEINTLNIHDITNFDEVDIAAIEVYGESGPGQGSSHRIKDVNLQRIRGAGIHLVSTEAEIIGSKIDSVMAFGVGLTDATATISGTTISGVSEMDYSWSEAYGDTWEGLEAGIYAPKAEVTGLELILEGTEISDVETGVYLEDRDLFVSDTTLKGVGFGISASGLDRSDVEVVIQGLTINNQARIGLFMQDINNLNISQSSIMAESDGLLAKHIPNLSISASSFSSSHPGVNLEDVTATIQNSTFDGNSTGIRCENSALTLNENTFVDNTYDLSGCE